MRVGGGGGVYKWAAGMESSECVMRMTGDLWVTPTPSGHPAPSELCLFFLFFFFLFFFFLIFPFRPSAYRGKNTLNPAGS